MTPNESAMERLIETEAYFTALEGLRDDQCEYTPEERTRFGSLTFCVLIMKGGLMATGEAEHLGEDGRKLARRNAIEKAVAMVTRWEE